MNPDLPITPGLDEFLRLAADRRVISVRTRLLADDLTPIGLYHQLCGQRSGTFLLESAERGVWSRWSFVGVDCAARLVGNAGRVRWEGRTIAGLPATGRPLEVLEATLATLHTAVEAELPPFTSGLVGYLGYDLIRELEQLPDTNSADLGLPDMAMMLVSDLAVLDHHRGELWLIANAINFDASPEGARPAWLDAVGRIQQMVARLTEPRTSLLSVRRPAAPVAPRRQRSRAEYLAMVETAREHIHAGDVFQVVPSQRFELDTTADPLDIYRELRIVNPSPYLFLLRMSDSDAGRFALVGSSPEALVTVKNGKATTRPIAGTAPRGADPEEDRRLETELLADEKERAEHLMLVDLGRNDLGRVCVPGSVLVTEFMGVHRYSHVMHLEASITGRLKPGCSALQATMACFPAGTLSGAPKIRAMQLIDDLEVSRRGVYGGVIGYFDFAGNSDTAIAIRTALIMPDVAHVQAGAGIVADSEPAREDAEAGNKAAAVLGAVTRAGNLLRLTASDPGKQTSGMPR